MKLQTETYPDYIKTIPKEGRCIIAQQTADEIIVYQAYNPAIARFAVENQFFGGSHYSYGRMSWLKPNFLWMMYRCGWAAKENQERVLAIWIKKTDFNAILKEAVFSSYKSEQYTNQEEWKNELANKEVRLQWDPDHDPHGNKQERKAIQLGLKGKILKRFGTEMITRIEDITDFVKTQKSILKEKGIENLVVPKEWVYQTNDEEIDKICGLIS